MQDDERSDNHTEDTDWTLAFRHTKTGQPPTFLILYDWPSRDHWEHWFCSLVRAMYYVAPTLSRLLINVSAMRQYASLTRQQVVEWNCNPDIFTDGVPEFTHVLDHCVQGDIRRIVGTLEYGTWGFWHKLCIAVTRKGNVNPVQEGPVNDSLSVTVLDQETIRRLQNRET